MEMELSFDWGLEASIEEMLVSWSLLSLGCMLSSESTEA